MDDFVQKKYSDTVSASDEAFAWLVMESYYDKWMNDSEEELDGVPGQNKGFTSTASKRQRDFQTYVGMVGLSRETTNAALWDEKLMEIAHGEVVNSNTSEKTTVGSEVVQMIVEETRERERDVVYLRISNNALGGDSSSSDNDSDDDSPPL